MAIISRRIPSQLAGAENCGPNQKWDPNYVFNGIKGQCIPSSQPLVQVSSGYWSDFMSAFSKPQYATQPAAAASSTRAPAGMSTNTKLALGLGAVGLVALIIVATRE